MSVIYSLPQFDYDPLTQYISPILDTSTNDYNIGDSGFLASIETLPEDPDDLSRQAYFKTVADSEFMDSSVGGHIALGMPYAFTRHAEPPRVGLLAGRPEYIDEPDSHKLGMSRAYAEMFQINSKPRILVLEFGKPKFRSMFAFFSSSVDYGKAIIANEGRTTFWYKTGLVAGTIGAFLVRPGLMALYFIGKLINHILNFTDDRYYSFKPDMHNYLQTANIILTQLQIERGLVKSIVDPTKTSKSTDRYGVSITLDTSYIEEFADLMPEIFDKRYGLDIYKIIARPQLMVNNLIKQEEGILLKGISTVIRVANPVLKPFKDAIETISNLSSSTKDVDKYGNVLVDKSQIPTSLDAGDVDEYKIKDANGQTKRLPHDDDEWSTDFSSYLDVVRKYGMENISLYVDYVGPSEITFTNSTKDIPAKSVINNIGTMSRDVRFSLSGGNVINDFVDTVGKAARDIVAGTLNGATFGLSNVILGLIGGGYLQFPKMHDTSSVTVPTHTFKMRLGGPYGNPLSLCLDIDVITALLFAGVAPLSTGPSSYTSPYLCRAFLRGILDIDFGMITSLSYKAGDGAGRNIYGQPLEVEVTFTISDFSDVGTAPVNSGFFGVMGGEMNDHDVLSKFLRTMGARSYSNSRYMLKNAKYRLASIEKGLNDIRNPAKWATMVGDSIIGDVMKIGNVNNSITKIFE
jgi:hypothetical protein